MNIKKSLPIFIALILAIAISNAAIAEITSTDISIFRMQAKQGDADAQFYLGYAYWNGEGVVTDKREAYIWYSIAKANGYEGAANNLREMNWDQHLSKSEIRAARAEAKRRMEEIENKN